MCLWVYGGMLTYIHQDVQIRERWQHRVNQRGDNGCSAAENDQCYTWNMREWRIGTWERIKYCLKTSENRCGTPTCCLAETLWCACPQDAHSPSKFGIYFFKYCKYTYHIVLKCTFLFYFFLIFVEITLVKQAEWCHRDICSLLCNIMYNISLKALLSKPPISHNKHLYVLLRSQHLCGWGDDNILLWPLAKTKRLWDQ